MFPFVHGFESIIDHSSSPRKLSKKRWYLAVVRWYLAVVALSVVSRFNKAAALAKKTELSKKRWHLAVVALSAASRLNKAAAVAKKTKDTPVAALSNSLETPIFQPHPSFPKIDQSILTHIVKKKDLNQLVSYDGVVGLSRSLKTDLENGINGDEENISHRHQAFGPNTYPRPPSKGLFHFVLKSLKDLTILILLVCAVLSLGFGIKEHGLKEGWYDGGSIFIAVFLVIAVSSIINLRQSRQFAKLSKVSNIIPVDVVRSGRRQQVSIFDVVVGDVVWLKIGDQVPADGLLVEGQSLEVDEWSMTGESDHVKVNSTQNPFLFSGTKVADGFGKMLVTSVGMNTTWGEIMGTISCDSNEKTPLEARLNKLTSSLGKVGLAVAFLVLAVLLVRYFTRTTKDENGNEFNGSKTKAVDIINHVVMIVAAVVVMIPEGLPLAVTLTLAYSMKRMMADQAMVRKLSACETMGSATTICIDKTGTLTLNNMTMATFWLGNKSMEEGDSSLLQGNVLDLLYQGVGLNTTGAVYKSDSESEFEFSGSPTEKAILSCAVEKLHMDMEKVKQSSEILHVEAFNATKKRSGALMRKKGDSKINVHWKGAAEMILGMCSHHYDLSGNIKALDDVERKKFGQIIEGMAAIGLRCIAFAHKQVVKEENEDEKIQDNCLTLLGLVGIKDPCRPGVKKAVEDCQYAGVNVKMITGDNVFTAKAIAAECGILRPSQDINNGVVIEGVEFRNYTLEERMEKVDKICVMARSSPLDKLLMVQCLKQKGHVVAVTGDGINDALALKEAYIGLSMGIRGTEVAKGSSDIVILDDNFCSVASVLRWGRCVNTNIQKFIQFQLSMNVVAVAINFVAAVSAGEVPLKAIQLLRANLIMDTLGALALATEKPTKELMEKLPVDRSQPLITNVMWRNLLAQAFYQMVVLLTLQLRGESIFGVNENVKDTLIFNTFVLCQVFNEFNARKLEKKNVFEGIQRNKLFLGIIGMTIVLQVVMVEFLRKFAGTERLNWWQWGVCIGISAMSWPIGWVVKYIPVPEKPFFKKTKKDTPVAASSNSLETPIFQPHGPHPFCPNIDQSILTHIVKKKDLNQLVSYDRVVGLSLSLKTDLENGINGDEKNISHRHQAFGRNTYPRPPSEGLFHFVSKSLKDLTILILLVCVALSLGFGIKEHGLKEGWYDGGSIFVVVFLVIVVSSISNFRQNRQFVKLSKVSNNIPLDVVRNGRRQEVSIFDIVVGDVVWLKIGDQVPADGLLIEGHSLQVDESSMTGESDHVEVNSTQNPFLFSGTKVADGFGKMLVTSVGMNTSWGEMMSTISYDLNEQTPLQALLNKLTSSIGKVSLAVAFLVLVVLLVRYFTGTTKDENWNQEFNGSKTKADDIINSVVGIVAAAVTIVVVAIPQGLPLAVMLTLAYSMKRMMANWAMVQKLSACETMGSATTICIGKTGTLTLNNMTVVAFWLGNKYMEEGDSSSLAGNALELLYQGVGLNATGAVYKCSSGSEFEFCGSPIEKAIISWAVEKLHMDMEEVKQSSEILHFKAFNSTKKKKWRVDEEEG